MGTAVQISDDFIPEFTDGSYGIENALAAYVRRRWPQNTVKRVCLHFAMTEGLARGVVYATGGLRGLNICIRKDGWPLLLFIGTAMLRHTLQTHIEKERERERTTWQRLDRGLRDMGDNLRAMRSVDADRRD